jgi:hypothetical protein
MIIFSKMYGGLFGKTDGVSWAITPGDNLVPDDIGNAIKEDKRYEKFFDRGLLMDGHQGTRRDIEGFLAPVDHRLISDLCAQAGMIPDHQIFDGSIRVDLADPLRSYDLAMKRGMDALSQKYGNLEEMFRGLQAQMGV